MAEALTVRERAGLNFASVMARKGVSAAELGKAFGLPKLPETPSSARLDSLSFWGTGPGNWLAIADRFDPEWPKRLETLTGSLASISDQSGSYVLFELSGPGARIALQRGVAVDLDPQIFVPGCVATSVIAHIGVILHHADAGYEVAVFRSYVGSFRYWLAEVIETV